MTDTPTQPAKDTVSGSSDGDLSSLLKSALDDFDEPSAPSAAAETPSKPAQETAAANPSSGFEEKFKSLLLADEDDASFSHKMTDLLLEANKEIRQSTAEPGSEGDAVSQAINSLVENIEEIKDSMAGAQLPAGNFDAADFKNDAMFPMMEQMFQMLMSKEVLYPSLLAVRDQYPSWLRDNAAKISAAEADRYTRQHAVIEKICVIFESESAADADDVKQKKFIELLGLLEQMTALGQPPSDFAESLPSMAGANDMPDGCNTM